MDPELQELMRKQASLGFAPGQDPTEGVQSPGQIAQSVIAPSASTPAPAPLPPSNPPSFLDAIPPAPAAPTAPPPPAPPAAPAAPSAPQAPQAPNQPSTDSYTAVPPVQIPGQAAASASTTPPAAAPATPTGIEGHSGPTVADYDAQFAQAQHDQNTAMHQDQGLQGIVAGMGANAHQVASLPTGERPLNDLLASRSAHAAAEKAVDDEAGRDQARLDNAPGGPNEKLARALVARVMGPDFDTSAISGHMLPFLAKELAPGMAMDKIQNWLQINQQKANTAQTAVDQRPAIEAAKEGSAEKIAGVKTSSNEKIAKGHDEAKVAAAAAKSPSSDSRGLGVVLRYATPVRNVQDQSQAGLKELTSLLARGISKIDPVSRDAQHLVMTADAITQELSKVQHGGASDIAVKHLISDRPKDVAPAAVWRDWFKQANDLATGIGKNLNEVSENYNHKTIVPGAQNATGNKPPIDTSTKVAEPSDLPPGADIDKYDYRKLPNGTWERRAK